MFRVNVAALRPRASLRVEQEIPASDALWADSDLVFGGSVRVELCLTRTNAGEVLARGVLAANAVHACRRCLERVEQPLRLGIELLWATPVGVGSDPDGGADLRVLEPGSIEIEWGEAVREELMLAGPRYVLCSEGCQGLCPRCGANRNQEPCGCVTDEADPRWEALRALNSE